ncbi:MAG: DNA polymerase III subunit gamma/tau [Patescibacteria group bacterium]|nr:DNA polymerase III subunit gamma/tau [Patescibacteria group bacterium]
MERQVLYRRWRPQKFADLIGQDHIKQTLVNSIKADRIAHAYLFAGPRGTGKTSMARLLAKTVNCLDIKDGEPCNNCKNCESSANNQMMDLIEIDAASNTGVDDVRALVEKVNFAPAIGKYKIYIIDEVHMLSKSAFNALLKTLEEPPPHALFILATTEVHKLLPTIISRCQYFDFRYLSPEEVGEQVQRIAKSENISISPDAVQLIIENSEGSMRDAISILDQAISFGEKEITPDLLKRLLGIVDSQVVQKLTQALIDSNALAGVNLVNESYFSGHDLSQLGKLWLSYLRELLMIKLGNEELVMRSSDAKTEMKKQCDFWSVSKIINVTQRLILTLNQYKVASLPQLPLELMIANSCEVAEKKVISSKPAQKMQEKKVVESQNLQINEEVKEAPKPKSSIETPIPKMSEAEMKEKLVGEISKISPSLSAILKDSKFSFKNGNVVIEVANKFLQDTLNKNSQRDVLLTQVSKIGLKGMGVECFVDQNALTKAKEVAEVFDIM